MNDDFRESGEYATSVGEKDFNLPKNRYRDILPCTGIRLRVGIRIAMLTSSLEDDYSRVTLEPLEPFVGKGDYINASFINVCLPHSPRLLLLPPKWAWVARGRVGG